ncbi:hypothetical protein COO60DRAFT_132486 [Scenedesmus sp. NREL 46B-D3]|nr:hypothetical protein COO60DRAFT_132486 [Scenedesmus sp. NREL 46B-D3]
MQLARCRPWQGWCSRGWCCQAPGWTTDGTSTGTQHNCHGPAAAAESQEQPHVQHRAGTTADDDSSADARCCSQLYVDFMAAADALGVWTVNDTAAAVEQCCKVWQVQRAAGAGSTGASSAAVQQLLSTPSVLRRLSELQLEGSLRPGGGTGVAPHALAGCSSGRCP